MKFKQVELTRSETTSMAILMPEWEIPVLAAADPKLAIQVTGEVDRPRWKNGVRAYPDAADEYARLLAGYKGDEGQAAPVEKVYGYGDVGVAKLAEAIEVVRAPAQAEAEANQKPKRGRPAKAKAEAEPTAPVESGIDLDDITGLD